MKIVKYIFLLLILACIAVTVFIATQEGKYNIKKEKLISVSKTTLYNYLNDYKNWENLGIFTNADTTATYTFSENTTGNGAFITWNKGNKGNKSGKITTLKATASDSIHQKALVEELNSDILWTFKDSLNSTKVSVTLKGQLTFTEKAYALLYGGVDNKVEASLQKGLDNLNTFLVKELKFYTAEVKGLVTKKGAFYLGQANTLPLPEVTKKAPAIFEKLIAFARENNITVTGAPFIIYKSRDSGQAAVVFSLPIKDEMFTAAGSEIEGGRLLPFNALKTTLKGDYSHLPKAWQAANKYIAEKALQENTSGRYLEVYAKTAAQTRRPSALVTDIYIPVGPPQEIVTEQPGTYPPQNEPAITPATTKPAAPATGTGTAHPATTTPARSTTTGTARPAPGSAANLTGATTGRAPSTAAPRNTTPSSTGRTATGTNTPASGASRTGTTTPTTRTLSSATTTSTSRPATAMPVRSTTTTGTARPAGTAATPTATTPGKKVQTVNTRTAGDNDSLNPPRAEK